jgi:hypothetical protein
MADLDTSTWSEVAASNSAAAPAGWPEGMAIASVNDSAREMMGALKREWNRSHPTVASAGTSAALTLSYTTAPAAYVQGLTFAFKVGTSCGDNPTLNVNSLGAKKLYVMAPSGTPRQAATGDLMAGMVVTAVYDAALDSAAGGFLVFLAGSAAGWRQIGAATAVSGAPATGVILPLPAWATMCRIEWEDAGPSGGAAAMFARLSVDSGVTYLVGGTDYDGAISDTRATGVSTAGMSGLGYLSLTPTLSTSAAVFGALTLRRAAGAPMDIASWGVDTTPTRFRRVAQGGGANVVPPTHLLLGFVGQSVAVGSRFTLFARA